MSISPTPTSPSMLVSSSVATPVVAPPPPSGPAAMPAANGSWGARPSAQDLRLAANPRQHANSGTQMFVGEPAIEPNDVAQGTGGTCTILAVGMSLANSERGRMWLTRNLSDEGNGNISVTLWNKPMSIPLDKVKSMPAAYGDSNNNPADPRKEIWVKALEAGYARGAKWLFGVEFGRGWTVGEPNLAMALRAISGSHYHVSKAYSMTGEQLFRDAGRALNEQKVVIAGTVGAQKMSPAQKQIGQAYGLMPNHAYAVLGLNAKTDTVWLGDPYGDTKSVPSAVFRAFFPQVGWGYIP